MEDNTKPAGELPPDLRKLTINVESVDTSSGETGAVDQIVVYGTREALGHLQALVETLIEALNEALQPTPEE